MKKLLSLAVLFCLFLTASALEYPLYKLSTAPKLDGIGNDEVWKYIPEGRGFYKIFGNVHFTTDRLTSFKMGWTDDALYIYTYCYEPTPDKIKVLYSYRDGFMCDESIEFFLLPKNKKNFLQMVMNAKGALYAQWFGARTPAKESDDIKVAAKINEDHWELEAKIPFKVAGITAKDLNGLKFNIARNATASKGQRFLSWARAIGRFGDVENFANFRLMQENGTLSPEAISHNINNYYDKSLNWKLIQIARKQAPYRSQKAKMDEPDLVILENLQQKIAKRNGLTPRSQKPFLYREWTELAANFTRPKCTFSMNVKAPGSLQIQLNGKDIAKPKGGKYTLNFTEGINVVTIAGESKKAGNLSIAFPGFADGSRSWKISATAPENWKSFSFDDRKWKPFTGKVPAGKFYLRQSIIWNQHFYGDMRCFNPPVKEWLFSQDSIDFFYMQVYSPVGRLLNSFCIRLDLPEGFTFLEKPNKSLHHINTRWDKVVRSKVTHDGKPYTRYSIYYSTNPITIDNWRTAESLLPIVCGKLPVGQKGKIYYSRMIDGNITEIPGVIPYRVLPRINGAIPKEPVLSFYMGHMQRLEEKAEDLMLRDTFASGFTTFFCGYKKTSYRDKIVAKGGQVTCGFLFHPYFGPKLKNSSLFRLMNANKELYATFFDGSKENGWNSKKHAQFNNQFFCPTLISTKYKAAFVKTIKEDMLNIFFKDYPTQKYTFINWEYEPWAELYKPSYKNMPAHCFCDHCKANFRKWAKIPASVKLDNQTLYRKYYQAWRDFRYYMDGKIHGIIGDALESIGKRAIFYTGSGQKGYWRAAAKAKFLPFPGSPGNPPADSSWQKHLDDLYKFFTTETIHKKLMGQRFIFSPTTYSWGVNKTKGYLKSHVHSHDGFLHPETWKSQLLRVMASFHGGLDIQNPLEMISGIRYYIGEATRLIAKHEKLFTDGVRKDDLAVSKEIKYPNLLVLTHGKERMVLAFNEGSKPLKVTLKHLGLPKNAKAFSFYEGKSYPAAQQTITIPASDVAAIYIKY